MHSNIILSIILLLIILFFFGSRTDIFAYPLLFSIFIINILSILSFILPHFSFMFALFISSFLMLMSLPFDFLAHVQKNVLSRILLFFYNTCILDFLAVVYITFFCVKSATYYKKLFFLFSLSLMHVFLSRWYFYQKIFLYKDFDKSIQVIIFLLLFIGVATSYFRFLLNLSLFVIPLTLKHQPSLLSPTVLYVFGEDNSVPTEKPTSSNSLGTEVPQKKFSLLNITFSRNSYRQYYNHTHNNSFKYMGFFLGFCTMGAGITAAFYAKEQAIYAKEQAYKTRRETDVAAVDTGLITKEEYYRRHPQDATSKTK